MPPDRPWYGTPRRAVPQVFSSTAFDRLGDGGMTRLTHPMICMPGTLSFPSLIFDSKWSVLLPYS